MAAVMMPDIEPTEQDQEQEGQDYFIGTYKTREEAERGLVEKDRTISRLNNQVVTSQSEADRVAKLMDAFYQQPTQVIQTPYQPAQQAGQGSFPWEQLPDPVEQPDRFKSAVADTIQVAKRQAVAEAVGTIQQQNMGMARVQQQEQVLWEYFQGEYPDLANYPEIIAGILYRNNNYVRHLGSNPAGILSQVAGEARQALNRYGMRRQSGGPGETYVPTGGRTGMPQGGNGEFSGGPDEPGRARKMPSLVDQIKAEQRKGGFF